MFYLSESIVTIFVLKFAGWFKRKVKKKKNSGLKCWTVEDESECKLAHVEKKNFYGWISVVFFVCLFFHIPFTQILQKVKPEHELALLNFWCHKHFLEDHWIGKCVGVSFFFSFFKLSGSPVFSLLHSRWPNCSDLVLKSSRLAYAYRRSVPFLCLFYRVSAVIKHLSCVLSLIPGHFWLYAEPHISLIKGCWGHGWTSAV